MRVDLGRRVRGSIFGVMSRIVVVGIIRMLVLFSKAMGAGGFLALRIEKRLC